MTPDPKDPLEQYLFDSFAHYRQTAPGPIPPPKWMELVKGWHGLWLAAQRKCGRPVVTSDCHRLYALYPRHIGKESALRAIAKALQKHDVEKLAAAVKRFKFCTDRWKRADRTFIPHCATWFNEGRFEDDQREWERGGQALEKDAEAPLKPAIDYPEPPAWLSWVDRNWPGSVFATGKIMNMDGRLRWAEVPRADQREMSEAILAETSDSTQTA